MKLLTVRLSALLLLCMLLFAGTAYAIAPISADAGAAILADAKSDTILYERNSREKMYPASTTKIMTALLVLERGSLSDVVTMEEADYAGVTSASSSAGLKVSEEVTVETLLYGLMLPSGNEAANALARYVSGSTEAFVELMNQRAKELGCVNTHFANPNGLHDDNHYTCAYDLYRIAKQAMTDETFCDIANTAQKTLPASNLQAERKVYTTNQLILRRSDPTYYTYCNGIKTGHTTPAGYCFVSAAEKKDSSLISVVLGCEAGENGEAAKSFTETIKLFDWGFDNFDYQTLVASGDNIAEIDVRLSSEKDYVVLASAGPVSGLVPNDIQPDSLTFSKHIPESIDAPVKKGDVIGTLTVSQGDTVYGTVDLVATTDVSLSKVLYYADKLETFCRSKYFLLVLSCVAALILLLFVVRGINRARRRHSRRSRRYRSRYDSPNRARRRGR